MKVAPPKPARTRTRTRTRNPLKSAKRHLSRSIPAKYEAKMQIGIFLVQYAYKFKNMARKSAYFASICVFRGEKHLKGCTFAFSKISEPQ
jgi:hypothetical protein